MRIILFFIAIFSVCSAHAADPILKTSCETTPAIWDLASPPDISNSNNLRRKTGSTEIAKGDFVTIEGRIFDQNCVPITEAIVEIWQANSLGINQFTNNNQKDVDQNFVATGKSITDNLGFYKFLTIFPGSTSENRAPHISFRIKHKDFQPIETEMFFENQIGNGTDKNLKTQVPLQKQHLLIAKGEKIINDIEGENVKYQFDVILEGKNKYKTY